MNIQNKSGVFSSMSATDQTRVVTRGVIRLFLEMDQSCLTEFTLKTGRRIDVAAIDKAGKISAIEVKVSMSDFRGDKKWQEYLPYCDAFYFAVPLDFPLDRLPDGVGVITADAYGAAIIEPAVQGDLNAARRKALTLRFARQAALRLQQLTSENNEAS